MLSVQERLAVVDQAKSEKVNIKDILYYNWGLSEIQVSAEIWAMVREGMIDVN